ncbi:extracellular solute-binding protein [Thermoflexus sp.]|uniref:extracellular solute-binding protein n=1 Tax=Thermoflexus sp. TaxID=1969742 RepID=UPI0033198151
MRVRRWLWALALLVSPACGPLARPPRLLVLWHALDRERAAALARLTEAYMAEHPESAIYIEAFPGPAELRARLERPSERGPDLLVVPAEMVPDLFQAGRLVPLARWLEDPTLGLPPEERGDLLAPLTPGSVPFLREGLLLYADLDRLMESGFDQPPADWEAVRQVCVRGALDLNGDGRPDTAGWVAPRDGWVLQGWLAGRSRRSAQGILERVQTMLRWGCAQLLEPSTALRMFVQGETAMLFGPSRWLPELERKAAAGRLRFRLAAAPPPYRPDFERPVLAGWGWDLAIAAADPGQQQAAWAFLRWTLRPEVQARWAQEAHSLPLRRSVGERLRGLLGSASLQSSLVEWTLEGYQEGAWVDGGTAARLTEALRLLEGGVEVPAVLAPLPIPEEAEISEEVGR